MGKMKFLSLSLLSNVEQAAIRIPFAKPTTIIEGGNGFGKSALVKSLYDTFGAIPHKIDSTWKNAKVATLLHFSIDGKDFAAFKFSGVYSIYNSNGVRIIQTNSVGCICQLN